MQWLINHNIGMSYDSTFLKVTTIELPTKCFTDHKMKTVGETILPRNGNLFQPISLLKIKKWFQFYGPAPE